MASRWCVVVVFVSVFCMFACFAAVVRKQSDKDETNWDRNLS